MKQRPTLNTHLGSGRTPAATPERPHQAIVLSNASGYLTAVNATAERTWGWKEGDRLPEEIRIILEAVESGTRQELPLRIAGLSVYASARNDNLGWELTGYRTGASGMLIPADWRAPRLFDWRKVLPRRPAKNRRGPTFPSTELPLHEDAFDWTAFISTLSHEIRTPVGTLVGYADLLSREIADYEGQNGVSLPEPMHEFTDILTDRARKLQFLIHDLFELASLERGLVTVRRKKVVLVDLISEALAGIEREARRKEIKLILKPGNRDLMVCTDATRLQRVIEHVVSNAIKFTDSGSVTVGYGVVREQAYVDIEDTGIGISEEYRDELFGAFSQEESWLTRRFDGAGFGLALSRRIMDVLGGTIEVESKRGSGSRFRISLPLAADLDDPRLRWPGQVEHCD